MKVRLLASALLLLCAYAWAAVPNIRYTAVLTPSGKVDTRYLDGNDGVVAIPLTWNAIPTIAVPSGSSYSVLLRSQFLNDAGTPSAALTLTTGSLPAGWTLNADTLDYSGTGTGSAAIQITATRLGVTSISNLFTVGAATLAPVFTAPTLTSVVATSPTSIQIISTAVTGATTYLTQQASSLGGTYTYLASSDTPNLTITITGLSPSTQYCFERAAASTGDATIGPYSSGACATTFVLNSAVKWHPGVYISLDPNTSDTANLAIIDEISQNCANCLGVAKLFQWSSLESAKGSYTTAPIDVFANKMKAANNAGHRNLRLIIQMQMQEYNGALSPHFPWYLPSYLNSGTYAGGAAESTSNTLNGSLTSVLLIWNAAVMDRMIALSGFLASAYDTNPLVEQYDATGESSIANIAGSGYSYSGYETQLLRFWPATRAQWQHTQIRWADNYLDTDITNESMERSAVANQITVGGPDNLPETIRKVNANYLWRGLNFDLSANAAYPDLRASGVWMSEDQSPSLGQKYCSPATCTLTQLQTYAHDVMHDSYYLIYHNLWAGNSTTQWTAIEAFINAGSAPVFNTTCPSSFLNGCNTQ